MPLFDANKTSEELRTETAHESTRHGDFRAGVEEEEGSELLGVNAGKETVLYEGPAPPQISSSISSDERTRDETPSKPPRAGFSSGGGFLRSYIFLPLICSRGSYIAMSNYFSCSLRVGGGWIYAFFIFLFSLFIAGRESNQLLARVLFSFLKFSFLEFPIFGKSLVVTGFQVSSFLIPSYSVTMNFAGRQRKQLA